MAEYSLKGVGSVLGLPRGSPSPSRSPERRPKFYANVLDPLLSNLSPDATLDALSAVDGVRGAQQSTHDVLAITISNASPSERAFGVRAALAAQKLKDWYKEVQSWQWVGKRDAGLGQGFLCPADGVSEEYLGSLPADLVDRYESRIEAIKDDMDSLDVEELKEHVLDQHIPARSRPGSTSSAISNLDVPLSHSQLSDFGALITATILHALPVLSRLNILLRRWTVRLRVIRLIPALRSGLLNSLSLIESALERISESLLPDSDDALFSGEAFRVARGKLEAHVSLSGSQMDSILDALEGHEDSLPESWIDEMEAVETGFSTWAAQAEKKAFQNEWLPKLKPHDHETPESNEPPSQQSEKTEPGLEVSAAEEQQVIADPKTEYAETPSSPENMTERTCEPAGVSLEENEGLSHRPRQPSNAPDQEPTEAVPTDYQGEDMHGMDESTIISDYDLTQSHLAVSSSISSIPSQQDQDEKHTCADPENSNVMQDQDCSTQEQQEKHDDIFSGEQSDNGNTGQLTSSVSRAENTAEPRIEIVDTSSHGAKCDSQQSPEQAHEGDALATSVDGQKDSNGSMEHRTGNPVESFSGDENMPRSGSIDSMESTTLPDSEAMPDDTSNKKLEDPDLQRKSSAIATPNRTQQDASVAPLEQPSGGIGAQTPGTARRGDHPGLTRNLSLPPEGLFEQGVDYQDDEDQVQHDDSHEIRQASAVSIAELSSSKVRSVTIGNNKANHLPKRRLDPLSLRRSFSSTSLTLTKSVEAEEDQLSAHRDLHEGISHSPERPDLASPTPRPDSPTSPLSPLTVNKRSKGRNPSGTNVSGRNAPQSKRLRPSPVITSSKRGTNSTNTSKTKSSEDQLEEKISSILTTLPGRIHLASSKDASGSEGLRRASQNENIRSASPASTRSSTPTPSFTLTPALRSRNSLGAQEDPSVKLYHLERVGKSAPVKPIKLFVRSVGEDGERVMVRVGGGWADLHEYLKEYVVHHGRRKVTEERFEIKGLPSRNASSNNYSGRLTPQPASNTGRTTPVPRSGSALDIRRPSSSLSVSKTRRLTATEADLPPFSPVNFEVSDQSEAPGSSKQRRQSVASSVSVDDPSTPPSGTRSTSTPLGLAGPKPRSKRVSMSPESEAWVDGVMGEARKKTQTLKHQFSSGTLRNLPPVAENDPNAGPKLRSVSDIGGGAMNRRAQLRSVNK